jgi:hypothetical protein
MPSGLGHEQRARGMIPWQQPPEHQEVLRAPDDRGIVDAGALSSWQHLSETRRSRRHLLLEFFRQEPREHGAGGIQRRTGLPSTHERERRR